MKEAIFVPDAHARACIAAIRSLGRAGYEVHAGSSDYSALGLKSRFAAYSVVYPAFNDAAFIKWLRGYVAQYNIKMIVPSEGILKAIQPVFDEFKSLLPVSDDKTNVFECFDKTQVVRKFINADPALGLMENHPCSAVVNLSGSIDAHVLPESSTGYYIKAEKLRPQGSAAATSFVMAKTNLEALAALTEMAGNWEFALVQQACGGFQIGVSVLMDHGKALAVSCVRDCHPLPHSRGTMSLRESCWFPEVAADTIKRLSHLKWQGCAMGEYRYDEQKQTFNLIEINFRYWQYLHLDLWAGMDYPLMQAQWFLEGKSRFENTSKLGVVCRDTWPGEVAQLVNEFRNKDNSFFSKIQCCILFLLRGLNPKIHSDFWFPGDRALYMTNLFKYLKTEFKALSSRLKIIKGKKHD